MSKKLLFTLATIFALVATSCSTQKFGYATTYLDYSAYTQQGFFLTELESVPFDYDALGSITVTEFSGKDAAYVDPNNSKVADELYEKVERSKVANDWRFASAQTAIGVIVDKARKAGGNGLVALKTTTIVDPKTNNVKSVTVSGMVIKRK